MTGDSFMGTDFTYEEIGGGFNYSEEYKAKRLDDEREAGRDCYVLELTSAGSDPLYEKIQMWVWQEEMVPVKLQFFDSGDILLKTLTMNSYQPVSGDLIPHELIMADNVKGTRTILTIAELSQEDVSDDVFTVRNLRR
jgi:hypothetical protein